MEAAAYCLGGYCREGTPQFGFEKLGNAAGAGAGAGDNFIVEDLLDFSNAEVCIGGDELGFDVLAGNSADSSTVTAPNSSSDSPFSVVDQHFAGHLGSRNFGETSLSGDLGVPYDEQAELEWLSNFVEESFSGKDLHKLQLISSINTSSSSETRSEITTVPDRTTRTTPFSSDAPVRGKARSKRSRAAPCSWSSRLLVLSPTTSSTESEDVNSAKRGPKASKKKENCDWPAESDGRKCLHCATSKTPQWRTGPMGPKTLCNACGVRYKSGRLVPEYRPAASPTFVSSKHSNSHRKVLELRKQNEVQYHPHPQHHQPFLHPGSIYEASGTAGDEFLIHHLVGPDLHQLI